MCVALQESHRANWRNCNNAMALTLALPSVCLHHMEDLKSEEYKVLFFFYLFYISYSFDLAIILLALAQIAGTLGTH